MKPAWKIIQKNQHEILNNHHVTHYLESGAPKIAKLVYNYNNYGLWYL